MEVVIFPSVSIQFGKQLRTWSHYSWEIWKQKDAFSKCLPATRKRKSGVFKFLRFRDGLVWTVGLTVETKLRFRDGLVWTAGLTVEIKLRFCDGLAWTVGLTVEIKLRFQISLALCGRVLRCNCTSQNFSEAQRSCHEHDFQKSIYRKKQKIMFFFSFLSLCRENCPTAKTRLQCSDFNQGQLSKFSAN